MTQIGNRIMEGGPIFMIPLLLIILGLIILFILGLLGKLKNEKALQLIGHLSLFGMVWGFLGSILGLIQAFDYISSIDDGVSQSLMANGLKITLITSLTGVIAFLIGRAAMFVLTIKAT